MLLLQREKISLKRDVILMLNADEEAGGNLGAGWMMREHGDLISSEFAINEGGGFGLEVQGKRLYTVQTGEKGTARFTLRAQGKPGHGSQPHGDNAVVKLARAIVELGNHKFPKHISKTARRFIEEVSSQVPPPLREGFGELLDNRDGDRVIPKLPIPEGMRAMIHAMTHNTATPTILTAGSKVNVIPSSAEAQVDGRLIPGVTLDDWERELRQVIPLEIDIEFQPSRMGIESGPDSPLFETISRVMGEEDPYARCVPYLSVGATDARHVSKSGTQVYGFCPMRGPIAEFERVHGHDERVSIDNIDFGTRALYRIVSEFVSQ
jgi:acetylornithine deacetylase/succinyl-diaminopimelate desuccinylase-like protein